MSYRGGPENLEAIIRRLERRLSDIHPGATPPNSNWVLVEQLPGPTLHYKYVPTGAIGPAIGTA